MANNQVKFDMSNLEELMKCLKDDYTLRIGIIGAKAKTQHNKKGKENLTNAELGTFHEFGGTSKNGKEQPPRRSFLEDSLKFRLKFNNEEMKVFRNRLFEQFFVKKAPQQFMQDLGAKCLLVIEEAFATNGFGKWKSLTKRTKEVIAKKHKVLTMEQAKTVSIARWRKADNFWNGKLVQTEDGWNVTSGRNILTETGKLRRSIGFKVFKNK